ncbi:MAG TPA: polynucleotide adenylyltransferase PcnB [Geobacteraceae bacterium]|nr:polynucleotide adenylyltransferase PcnB [Geobacteraceae bacterium]
MQPLLPKILKRSSHNISRTMISPNALRILYRLRDNGFKACLVGGSVRDLLINRAPKDFDIVTDATPEQIRRLFRNCRLIGRRFRLAHIHFRDEMIEVATFRASGEEPEPDEFLPDDNEEESPSEDNRDRHHGRLLKSEGGMLLRDNLFGSPEEDAWRRDFTINALSYSIADFSVIDYVGGLEDLERRVIRTIGDPWDRFTEDPVRMIRAVRLSAQLGFDIDKISWKALVEMSVGITNSSPARLFDELLKTLLSGSATECYRLLRSGRLFNALLPAFDEWLDENGDETLDFSLRWIDSRLASGGTVSSHLFLAVIFGEHLGKRAEALPAHFGSFQDSVDHALAGFMRETSGTLQIPQRTVMRLREILLLEERLVKIPGRKPMNVVSRPGFSDAIEYLRFKAGRDAHIEKVISWWERYVGEGLPHGEPQKAHHEPGKKRRRRKRRGDRSGSENT